MATPNSGRISFLFISFDKPEATLKQCVNLKKRLFLRKHKTFYHFKQRCKICLISPSHSSSANPVTVVRFEENVSSREAGSTGIIITEISLRMITALLGHKIWAG